MRRWRQDGDADALLSLWVRGAVVDWSRLDSEANFSRVHLPTYPFERKRYWVGGAERQPETASRNGGEQTLSASQEVHAKLLDRLLAKELNVQEAMEVLRGTVEEGAP